MEGQELIQYALNERVEEKILDRWIIGYQKEMPLDEFKSQIGFNPSRKSDSRTAEEILNNVRDILSKGR